jgi:hypothetical protein
MKEIDFQSVVKADLSLLVKDVGLKPITAKSIELDTIFQNFNDHWQPFLSNVGPAPNYIMRLNERNRKNLKTKFEIHYRLIQTVQYLLPLKYGQLKVRFNFLTFGSFLFIIYFIKK